MAPSSTSCAPAASLDMYITTATQRIFSEFLIHCQYFWHLQHFSLVSVHLLTSSLKHLVHALHKKLWYFCSLALCIKNTSNMPFFAWHSLPWYPAVTQFLSVMETRQIALSSWSSKRRDVLIRQYWRSPQNKYGASQQNLFLFPETTEGVGDHLYVVQLTWHKLSPQKHRNVISILFISWNLLSSCRVRSVRTSLNFLFAMRCTDLSQCTFPSEINDDSPWSEDELRESCRDTEQMQVLWASWGNGKLGS